LHYLQSCAIFHYVTSERAGGPAAAAPPLTSRRSRACPGAPGRLRRQRMSLNPTTGAIILSNERHRTKACSAGTDRACGPGASGKGGVPQPVRAKHACEAGRTPSVQNGIASAGLASSGFGSHSSSALPHPSTSIGGAGPAPLAARRSSSARSSASPSAARAARLRRRGASADAHPVRGSRCAPGAPRAVRAGAAAGGAGRGGSGAIDWGAGRGGSGAIDWGAGRGGSGAIDS